MNNKSLFLVVFVILSASIVFAMGKVDAVDSGTTAIAAPTATAVPKLAEKRYSFIDVNKAQSDAEKRRILLEMIKSDPETEEDWAIAENNQFKRDAAYELLALKPTRDNIQTVADQIFKEKYSVAKQELMDAISYATYKDIAIISFKKIAETDTELIIRGFAVKKIIKLGDEREGYEYFIKLINYMNDKGEIDPNLNVYDYFKESGIREKVKKYLCELRDDQNMGKMIRCYAVLVCKQKYETDLSEYYSLIENYVLDKTIEEKEVIAILNKLTNLSRKNDKNAKAILDKTIKEGNSIVKKILEKP